MSAPWTAQDAAHLQSLRMAAHLDIARVAIENALSLTQLQQLENGGDAAFYSPAIKAHTGRKLLAKLQQWQDRAPDAAA